MSRQWIPIVLAIIVVDHSKDFLFVIPLIQIVMREKILPILCFFFWEGNFLPYSSIFSIFQFFGKFLHGILHEDGPSSPICYTNAFSLVELDLPVD